jgi:uncharacterized protein YndB with AHSA1/START domain
MANDTLSIQRILKASPEQVYRACTGRDAIAFWLPPYGYTCQVDDMDLRIGGAYHMTFVNFLTGQKHPFGGNYLDLKPNEFIRHTDEFDDARVITSISIKKVSVGTELTIVSEGLPANMTPEMCLLGWQESLEKLAKLVEAKIPPLA